MNFLLNIAWLILGGVLVGLAYLLGGIILCITIIGIPFGLQCFKIAGLGFTPFGKTMDDVGGTFALGFLGNLLWLVFAGFWIFLTHIGLAIGLAVTLIGIPFAFQHLKLAMLALWPFGTRVRSL